MDCFDFQKLNTVALVIICHKEHQIHRLGELEPENVGILPKEIIETINRVATLIFFINFIN